MTILSHDRFTARAGIEQRLENLCKALDSSSSPDRNAVEHPAARLLLGVDDMTRRVLSLSTLLGNVEEGDWDLVDQAAAQLVLRDLGLIARDLRSVLVSVTGNLADADERVRGLTGALVELDRQIEREEVEIAKLGVK
jgi:hypothetical protein